MNSSISEPSYLVDVCVDVAVTTGMLKYEEQKALAGICCFSAVTSLLTAGHKAGVVVAAGTGFAPATANKAAKTSDNMMIASRLSVSNTIKGRETEY